MTSVSLSVEELLVVLSTLGVNTIAGLVADTWTTLPADQQDLTLSVAMRGLEARGLARAEEDGIPRLHRALLTAVGVCAFPARSIVVDYWSTAGVEPKRTYAHALHDGYVVHAVDGGVHEFAMFSSPHDLADRLADRCNWQDHTSAAPFTLQIQRATFTQICEAAATGHESEAVHMLASCNAGAAPDASAALVRALSNAPRVSIVQTVKRVASGPPEEDSFTVIDDDQAAWLVATNGENDNDALLARTVSGSELRSALLGGA